MDTNVKREREENNSSQDAAVEEPATKSIKLSGMSDFDKRINDLRNSRGRPIPKGLADELTESELELMETVKTSCLDVDKICQAIKLRIKYKLPIRVPEDYDDSTYYIENGLRKVYPYPYLYQSFVKRRWIGSKLRDVLINDFRDISEEILKQRFDLKEILINGSLASWDHVLKDNDFICNRIHRHELPILGAPLKIIYQDRDTLVVNKPPSLPIHPCGRYRHNSVLNILRKEHNMDNIHVVHRLDRLVSGVLLTALNPQRAHELEISIRNRDVRKEYVCRVEGEFPLGDPSDDGEITVDQPLEVIPNKIGISVVLPEGKPSLTKFRRLNFNGKTSAVLCKPLSGRMHQIRVHLQYLGYPIVNDGLYNCDTFGPEKGKGGKFGGKSLKQLSDDVVAKHRADIWLISESNDFLPGNNGENYQNNNSEKQHPENNQDSKTVQFISDEEREETMASLEHFSQGDEDFSRNLTQKFKYDSTKHTKDSTCRDCCSEFYDPPLRSLYMYLHALKYSGSNWCYESEMPIWAKETWKY